MENNRITEPSQIDVIDIIFKIWHVKYYIIFTGIVSFVLGYLIVQFQESYYKDEIIIYSNNSLNYNVSLESVNALDKRGISTVRFLEQFIANLKNSSVMDEFISDNLEVKKDIIRDIISSMEYSVIETEINKKITLSYKLSFESELSLLKTKELLGSFFNLTDQVTFNFFENYVRISLDTVKLDAIKYYKIRLDELKTERTRLIEAISIAQNEEIYEAKSEIIDDLKFDATKIPLHFYGTLILEPKLRDIESSIASFEKSILNPTNNITSYDLQASDNYSVPSAKKMQIAKSIQNLINMEFIQRDFNNFVYDQNDTKLPIVIYDIDSFDRDTISFFSPIYKYYLLFIGMVVGCIVGLLIQEYKKRNI